MSQNAGGKATPHYWRPTIKRLTSFTVILGAFLRLNGKVLLRVYCLTVYCAFKHELKKQDFNRDWASRGIGQALSLELARAGVNLVLCARSPESLEETHLAVRALGVAARAVPGDVVSAQTVQALVTSAQELGNFHGFIHNAGVLNAGPLLWELKEERWREVLDSQLMAGYQLIRASVPLLLETSGGVAVFLGSEAAESNLAGIGAYAIAKAGVEHLARQLAAEAPQIVSFIYRPGR